MPGRPAKMPPPMQDIPSSIPRAALVTGGGKRLGRAISLALAATGFDIALHCRTDADDVADTVREIGDLGRQAIVLSADLNEETETASLIGRAVAALGPIGVLVNNASVFERDEWDTVTRTSWDAHMQPNLRAPFALMQEFGRTLPAQAEGVVVNMLDQRVWSLTQHFVSYTVSKAALWALTQTMALALAPRIRVNAVGPGPALPSPRQSMEQFARQSASVPLGHGTFPAEVGRAVVALLGMPAITGQMIALDGGQHLQWQSGSSEEE